MSVRLNARVLALGLATLVPLVAIAATLTRGLRPVPTLEQVTDLAQSGRFDEAEARADEYLNAFPGDPDARLVMAEIALSRPSPDPQRAIEQLDWISMESSPRSAWVLVDKGNAYHQLGRFAESEKCWKAALKREPGLLEACRRLLDLFGLEGRLDDAHDVVYRQLDLKIHPSDQLFLLLRLTRLDVDPPDPSLVIRTFEQSVKNGTADLPSTLACGLALVTASRSQEGLPMLRLAVDHHPDSAGCWDALLTGLELAGEPKEVTRALGRLPAALADDRRIARHRGWVEQEAGRWSEAARFYCRAWKQTRDNIVGYRLRRTLRLAGRVEEAERFDREVLGYREAFKQTRATLDEVSPMLEAGKPLPPALPAVMSELRGRMGRDREARAWRSLVPTTPPEPANRTRERR
jgi:tetratricopeptide (TPR) repeat protein